MGRGPKDASKISSLDLAADKDRAPDQSPRVAADKAVSIVNEDGSPETVELPNSELMALS